MGYLVDTNILLRSCQPDHPMYKGASTAVETLLEQGQNLHLTPQNIVEFWNVSTRPLIERRQKAEGRRQKDQLQGDSNPPATVDRQIEDFGGGFEPKSKKGEGRFEPSALCPKTSAFQGGSLGKNGLGMTSESDLSMSITLPSSF